MTTQTITPSQRRAAEMIRQFGRRFAIAWADRDPDDRAPILAATSKAISETGWSIAPKTGALAKVVFEATNDALQLGRRVEVVCRSDWLDRALTLKGRHAELVASQIIKACLGIDDADVDLSFEGAI